MRIAAMCLMLLSLSLFALGCPTADKGGPAPSPRPPVGGMEEAVEGEAAEGTEETTEATEAPEGEKAAEGAGAAEAETPAEESKE